MENILFYISYFISCLFEVYIISKFMKLFWGEAKVKRTTEIIAYISRVVIASLMYFYYSYVYINIIISLITLVFICACYNSKVANIILSCVYIYMCLFISEALLAALINIKKISFIGDSYEGNALTYLGVQSIFWLIYQIIRQVKSITGNEKWPLAFSCISIILNITCLTFEIIILSQESLDKSIKILSIICMLLIIFIVAYLQDSVSQNVILKMQEEIAQSEKKYYCMQADLLRKNTEDLRKFRHDINNHLSVLYSMSSISHDVSDYISNLAMTLKQTDMYSNTGNIAIDSIINYKLTIAKQMGIDVQTELLIPNEINIDNDDVVSIIGNLLDNSIEAQEHVIDDKFINVKIIYKKGTLFLIITNSFDGILIKDKLSIKTRKDNHQLHGLGLKSVNSAVNKYNGHLEIESDTNVFKVKILLYVS